MARRNSGSGSMDPNKALSVMEKQAEGQKSTAEASIEHGKATRQLGGIIDKFVDHNIASQQTSLKYKLPRYAQQVRDGRIRPYEEHVLHVGDVVEYFPPRANMTNNDYPPATHQRIITSFGNRSKADPAKSRVNVNIYERTTGFLIEGGNGKHSHSYIALNLLKVEEEPVV